MDKMIIVLTAAAYKTGGKVAMREERPGWRASQAYPLSLAAFERNEGSHGGCARAYAAKKTRKRPTYL